MYENIDRQNNTMTVNGRGKVTAIPDIAVIRLGVLTTGENLNEIQEENASISQVVISTLRQMGLTDIRTHQYSIEKLYDYQDNIRIDRGYSVRNILELRTDMPDTAGHLIDTAVSLGANLVESITFEVSMMDQYYIEALNMAFANATDKAQSIAIEFGARLNPLPIKVVENSSSSLPFSRAFLGEGQFTTPIEPGTTQIEASVLLVFSYT